MQNVGKFSHRRVVEGDCGFIEQLTALLAPPPPSPRFSARKSGMRPFQTTRAAHETLALFRRCHKPLRCRHKSAADASNDSQFFQTRLLPCRELYATLPLSSLS